VGSSPADFHKIQLKLTPILAAFDWAPGRRPPSLGIASTGNPFVLVRFAPAQNRAIPYERDRRMLVTSLPPPALAKFFGSLVATPGLVSNLLIDRPALSLIVLRDTGTNVLASEVFVSRERLHEFAALLTDISIGHEGFPTILQWELNL